ncbi:MAG: peptidogalycan biosysnthesis protein, partial [Pseudomonadota bacterium]
LNKPFFVGLAEQFSSNTLVLLAHYENTPIAGGLYFKSDHTLYGRYWGALHNFHSVHFETCYYQPIQWCIENQYRTFEAGAQGEHKLARGLSPVTTYSLHWLADKEFHRAIGRFIEQEQSHISDYQDRAARHTPFRKEV